MGDNRGDGERVSTENVPALPDLDPCRAAGWIFRNGDCIAIDRQDAFGVELHTPVLAD
jgi:hypothetical protein